MTNDVLPKLDGIRHSTFSAFAHSALTMMPLADRVLETMRRHALLRDGQRVLVALSGGADSGRAARSSCASSSATASLTRRGRGASQSRLRGADADADEAFCAALAGAARRAVPSRSALDVAALARARKRSIEDAARAPRYAFFERAAAGARRRTSSRSRTRKTIRPRRSCCGCCAAPARAGLGGDPCRARRTRRSGRCSTSSARSCARISPRAARRAARTRRTPTSPIPRAIASGTS